MEALSKTPVKKKIFFFLFKSGEPTYHFLRTIVTLNLILAMQLRVNTLFARVLYINCAEENLLAICRHEFMLQTNSLLLENLC